MLALLKKTITINTILKRGLLQKKQIEKNMMTLGIFLNLTN